MRYGQYGRYEITDDFKVLGIITDNGIVDYDPFESKEILPTWGVYCTTFYGLNEANRLYLINNSTKEELETLQYQIFWVFWFADTSLSDQKELFFYEDQKNWNRNAKDSAYSVLNIFNSLLEANVRRLLNQTINDLNKLKNKENL